MTPQPKCDCASVGLDSSGRQSPSSSGSGMKGLRGQERHRMTALRTRNPCHHVGAVTPSRPAGDFLCRPISIWAGTGWWAKPAGGSEDGGQAVKARARGLLGGVAWEQKDRPLRCGGCGGARAPVAAGAGGCGSWGHRGVSPAPTGEGRDRMTMKDDTRWVGRSFFGRRDDSRLQRKGSER